MIDRLEGQPLTVERGEFAPKDPEWLRTLALHIKNTGSKEITFLEFAVSVSNLDGDVAEYKLAFTGTDPKTGAPKPIKPEKAVKLTWSGDDYKAMKKVLADHKVFYPSAAVFRLHVVSFADGSSWRDGR
jgi:hypothetical protein